MEKKELIKKIIEKKDFSRLALEDVELAFSHFEKRAVGDEEKVRLTRELLHKVFGAFTSKKLLSPKDKDFEWVLRKHLSTRERIEFYDKIYSRILGGLEGKVRVIDLGAGVNGFSYPYFRKLGFDVAYTGVESVGQLVDLMNTFFDKNKFGGKAVHLSLFDLKELKNLIRKKEKPRVVFLFKVIDSLEMMERDYSKKLILEVTKNSERVVLSFATESMIRRKKFRAERNWILDFVRDAFSVSDEFEIGGEKFIVFEKKIRGLIKSKIR